MTAVPHWKVWAWTPQWGFAQDRPGRPSLALDLLEEFRPLLADRLALSLINRKQVGEQDFQYMDNGAVLLTESSRKTVLVAYQERKREELRHVFIDENRHRPVSFHSGSIVGATSSWRP